MLSRLRILSMMSERLRRRGTASTKSGIEEGVVIEEGMPLLVERFESGGVPSGSGTITYGVGVAIAVS